MSLHVRCLAYNILHLQSLAYIPLAYWYQLSKPLY
jgi:hypothetical protein